MNQSNQFWLLFFFFGGGIFKFSQTYLINSFSYKMQKSSKKNMNYNYISVVCPRLNPFASDPIVITSLNQYELRLSTYDRKPGTEVTLTCVDDLQIQGQSVITCQDDGNWNFDSRPYCASRNMLCYMHLFFWNEKQLIFKNSTNLNLLYIYVLIWMIIYEFIHFQNKRLHKWKKTQNIYVYLYIKKTYLSLKMSSFSYFF